MGTQEQQPEEGVNPGGTGPAQPKHVEDPHPSDEEGYTRERRPGVGSGDQTDKSRQDKPTDKG